MTIHEAPHRPLEISIPARSCNGPRYHTVGDLLTYRSARWTVKGFYLGATLSGEPELYYILGEAAVPSQHFTTP